MWVDSGHRPTDLYYGTPSGDTGSCEVRGCVCHLFSGVFPGSMFRPHSKPTEDLQVLYVRSRCDVGPTYTDGVDDTLPVVKEGTSRTKKETHLLCPARRPLDQLGDRRRRWYVPSSRLFPSLRRSTGGVEVESRTWENQTYSVTQVYLLIRVGADTLHRLIEVGRSEGGLWR